MSGDRYLIADQQAIYFLTLTVVDWVDVFTRKEHRLKIVESLSYCQSHKGLILYAWVVMSNHLHLIASAKEGYILSDIIRDFKKFTAKAIIAGVSTEPESRRDWMLYRFEFAGKFLKRIKKYKFWRDGNHAIVLDTNHLMEQKLHYIHHNPVEALIVSEPEHYIFSSARQYAGQVGLISCVLIE
ncbi:transposase [Reichenbachiella sp. MSK19-1]|uniref:REP-associated tyrosine transposase n=1 Tax=Reichenbachiella sp. MSK19-1 TaxID=1897631 RepID=UPI000E6D35DF|nr:transposase [Reichenbachiella sp. MSK19-1]RJE73943.1 transposase [Reichenbachiella sp. MSK19-1]